MEQEVKKIDIQLSMICNDLENGFTWKASEDVGYGSIQAKYNLKDFQVEIIKKHPKLKDKKPNIVLINLIDDLDEVVLDQPKVESQPIQTTPIEKVEQVKTVEATSSDVKTFMNL